MSYPPPMMLVGLICILGGLYLIWKELKLVEENGRKSERSGSLGARLGKMLKLDISNYGPGVIALVLGAVMVMAVPYLRLNSRSQTFTIEGTVQTEGAARNEGDVVVLVEPPKRLTSDGKFIFSRVTRKPNGEFPKLVFMAENYKTKHVKLNPSESDLEDRTISMNDTIILHKTNK